MSESSTSPAEPDVLSCSLHGPTNTGMTMHRDAQLFQVTVRTRGPRPAASVSGSFNRGGRNARGTPAGVVLTDHVKPS